MKVTILINTETTVEREFAEEDFKTWLDQVYYDKAYENAMTYVHNHECFIYKSGFES